MMIQKNMNQRQKVAGILAVLWLVVMTTVIVAVLTSCTPRPPVPPQPIPPNSDSGTEITCADVCRHLSGMMCPSAEPTKNGATCVEVCENVQSSGTMTFDMKCLITAPSCKAADECG